MNNLNEGVLKLSKAEQYEIYEAIEARLFGENEHKLTKEQEELITERLALIDSGLASFIDPETLKEELNQMLK